MNFYEISEYLHEFDRKSNKGKCKSCFSAVPWSRERVSTHKRLHCPNVTAKEKKLFAKRKFPENSFNVSNESSADDSIELEVSTVEIDAAVNNLFNTEMATQTPSRNRVWEFATRKSIHGKTTGTCKKCGAVIKCSGGSTTTLKNHLLSVHKINFKIGAKDSSVSDQETLVGCDIRVHKHTEMEHNFKMGDSERSWVWKYYKELAKASCVCNVCDKTINKSRTSIPAMVSHLNIHNITSSEQNGKGRKGDIRSSQRHWVWDYFSELSRPRSLCTVCNKSVSMNRSSTTAMRTHLKAHNITESTTRDTDEKPNKLPRPVARKRSKASINFISIQEENFCFICCSLLDSCRIPIKCKSEASDTPLWEIIEPLGGTSSSEKIRSEGALCNRCYLLVEKLDDLKVQSRRVHEKLSGMLQQTQSEQIFIKQETEECFDDDELLNSDESYSENEEDDDDWSNTAKTKRSRDGANKSSTDVMHDNILEKDIDCYCEECLKSFKNALCLQMHLATDHDRNEGAVDCPICFKTYKDQSTLKKHYVIHSMPRSLLCGQCGATFAHKRSFDTHMMMHENIRRFACTIPGCPKRFISSDKLIRHLRVHSGEKIYECPYCPGKRFAQKYGLDLHVKKQHNNEAIQNEACKICGVRVPSKAKMKLHLAKLHDVVVSDVENSN